MKTKRYSLLLVGLLLILATSVLACNQPATITQSPTVPVERPVEPAAIHPAPRTITQTGPSLFIPMKAGQRVKIEVTINTPNKIILSIFDPNGNKVGGSATTLKLLTGTSRLPIERSIQEYPWHYAFIAATDGDYVITLAKSLELAKHIEAARSSQNVSLLEGELYTFKATIYP